MSEGGIAPAPFEPQPLVGDGASQSDPSPLGGAVTLHLTDGTTITRKGFPPRISPDEPSFLNCPNAHAGR